MVDFDIDVTWNYALEDREPHGATWHKHGRADRIPVVGDSIAIRKPTEDPKVPIEVLVTVAYVTFIAHDKGEGYGVIVSLEFINESDFPQEVLEAAGFNRGAETDFPVEYAEEYKALKDQEAANTARLRQGDQSS
jgi:hypothetical protein